MDTIKEFLDYEPKIREGTLPAPEKGCLELKNVSFRYPGQESDVLRKVSIRIRHGERIALVGHNGAGKSTLVKLMLRLYDPTEGEILYAGRNVKDYLLTGETATGSVSARCFRISSCFPCRSPRMCAEKTPRGRRRAGSVGAAGQRRLRQDKRL